MKLVCRLILGIKIMGEKKVVEVVVEDAGDDEDDDEDDGEFLLLKIVGMVIVLGECMVFVSEEFGLFILFMMKKGKGKVVVANSYRLFGRGRSGVMCMKFKKGDDDVLVIIIFVDCIGDDVMDEVLFFIMGGIFNCIVVNDLFKRSDFLVLGVVIIKFDVTDVLKFVNLFLSEVVSEFV